ncbi:MAG: hypothetical protein ACI857_001815 [Arenicella sp.]
MLETVFQNTIKKIEMNKIYAKAGLGLMLVAFLGLSTLQSCRKEQPTVAKIRVVDTSGAVFPNAMVRLYPTPSIIEHGAIIIDDTLFTDVDGYATFDYTDMFNLGQAGFTVLDIEVRSGDTLYGEGIIKIVEEVISEETVILQP